MTSAYHLENTDDGHKPGNTDKQTRIAINKGKHSSNFVAIFDDLMEERWCDRVYRYSSQVHDGKPWGVYVLTDDTLNIGLDCEELWREAEDAEALLTKSISDNVFSCSGADTAFEMKPSNHTKWHSVHDKYQRAIGVYASRKLLLERGGGILGTDLSSTQPRIHGTVVWSLCSSLSSSVEYHIDYAELYRYETNIIHPPLYAGTVHVSPLGMTPQTPENSMGGGAFCVNTFGLDHYKDFGYKGKKAGGNGVKSGAEAILLDQQASPAWQEIRYKRNRGILHDGDFPHFSTPVLSLPSSPTKVVRCILGFNCFAEDVGEACLRAPEHSRAFNRTIRLYQTLGSITSSNASNKKDGSNSEKMRLNAKQVLKNPALARLIVAAAKLKKANDVKSSVAHNVVS
jgi:hypothetical protein